MEQTGETMITANPNSPLGYWCRKVAAMKPGERLDVDLRALMDISTFEHNGARFTAADRILGNIVGSAWTHSFHEHPDGRTITFVRHVDTGERRHTDPDRRHITT